jgi:hypothetical protein
MYIDSYDEDFKMDSEQIKKALFAQQRAQIMQIKSLAPDLIPNSYAYAWSKGLYPFFHDGDYSVPDYPHENFKELFKVGEEFAMQVINYMDQLWLDNNPPTFYELEREFGGKSRRCELIHICRYAFLNGGFDDELWDALLTKMQHPSEAQGITRDFCDRDFSIL